MAALNSSRDTKMMATDCVATRAAGGVTFFRGGMVALNAAGLAIPAKTAVGLTYWGVTEESVSTANRTDGEVIIVVRRNKAFKWLNAPADQVTQALIGKQCFMVDDQTVAATHGGNTRSPCGQVIAIEGGCVWVA